MTIKDLYKFLSTEFTADQITLDQFVNPLNHPALNTQFIYQHGHPHTPLVQNPQDFQFPDPLAGPFYDLEVVGLLPYRLEGEIAIRAIVKMPSGELYDTSPFYLSVPEKSLEVLAVQLGIKWYHADLLLVPREFTEMSNFADCLLKHALTAASKDRILLH